jgi:hypothetical protein
VFVKKLIAYAAPVKHPKEPKPIASTVSICAKCSDLCFTEVKTKGGTLLAAKDGYVPEFMPGEHYGDYVILDIDIATGKILNWNPGKYIQKFIDENTDKEENLDDGR